MGSDDDLPDVTPRDAIQIAQRALAKANRVDDLQERVDELEEQVTELELRQSGRDQDREYASLSLDEKIGMVREHAFKKATATNGYAKVDYNGVRWEVFDKDPSTKHCYKLLRLAAEGVDGFEYCDPDGESKHLRVDATAAKRNAAFFQENKTREEARGR
jgi:hypothetical protein